MTNNHPISLPAAIVSLALVSCASTSRPTPTNATRAQTALPPLVQRCEGTHLDLAWLARSDACNKPLHAPQLPTPADLVVRLESPEPTVEPGGSAQIDYVIHNPKSTPVTFDLVAWNCYTDNFEVRLFDQTGERADRLGPSCEGFGSCSMPDVRLTLSPGGDARLRLQVRAESRTMNQICELEPAQPLAPGTYTLEISPDSTTDVLRSVRGELSVGR